jgi:hypothetical protein
VSGEVASHTLFQGLRYFVDHLLTAPSDLKLQVIDRMGRHGHAGMLAVIWAAGILKSFLYIRFHLFGHRLHYCISESVEWNFAPADIEFDLNGRQFSPPRLV